MNDENKAPQLHATSHATARAKGSRRKGKNLRQFYPSSLFFIALVVGLPACPPVYCLPACLPACLLACLPVCLPVCLQHLRGYRSLLEFLFIIFQCFFFPHISFFIGSKSSGSSGKDHKDTPPASRPRSVQVNVPHAAPSGGTRNEGINSEGSALNGTGIINSINSNGRNASITPPATIYRVSASHRKAPRVFGVLFKPGPMGVEFQAAGTGGGCVVHRIKKTAMESTSSSPSEGTNSKRLNSEFQRGVLSIDALRPGDRVVAVDGE